MAASTCSISASDSPKTTTAMTRLGRAFSTHGTNAPQASPLRVSGCAARHPRASRRSRGHGQTVRAERGPTPEAPGERPDRRFCPRGERAQLPIETLQFGITFGKQRREPVAFADQLLHPARALFDDRSELLAALA